MKMGGAIWRCRPCTVFLKSGVGLASYSNFSGRDTGLRVMGNKAGKKKHRSELDSSESAGNDFSPPSCESSNEIAEPAPSQDTGPDKESEPPPDTDDLPPDGSSDPPHTPSIAAESESNLKCQQARNAATPLIEKKVSRQERRRKQRMKRKFKGNLTRYIFVLVHRNREVAIAMAFHKKL